MSLTALAAIGLALSLDLLVGEPPTPAHPVAWFGRLVGVFDREWDVDERRQRWLGVGVALALPLFAAAVVFGLVEAAGAVSPMVGAVAASVALFLVTSLRALLDLTREVVDASEADLPAARESVRGLVGRDPETLSAAGIRSAAVESAAENLADGFVATLLPFAALAPFSVPLAAAAAAWVKAVNTLDSMLGYRSKPVGAASARLDDAVMWLPARATALLIAVASADLRALAAAREWAGAPPSPNSGWPMATLACALGVRLEKPDAYVLVPDRALPTVVDGGRAITIVGRAALLAVVVAVALVLTSPSIAATLAPIVEAAVDVGIGLLEFLWELLVAVIEAVVGLLEAVAALLEAVVDAIRSILRGIADLLSTAAGPVGGTAPDLGAVTGVIR